MVGANFPRNNARIALCQRDPYDKNRSLRKHVLWERPLGANDMLTIGDWMRARQLISIISVVAVLTITTELSDVEIKTSG